MHMRARRNRLTGLTDDLAIAAHGSPFGNLVPCELVPARHCRQQRDPRHHRPGGQIGQRDGDVIFGRQDDVVGFHFPTPARARSRWV